jgi:hypothetical protein
MQNLSRTYFYSLSERGYPKESSDGRFYYFWQKIAIGNRRKNIKELTHA